MGSLARRASWGLARPGWHRSNGAAWPRRGRSLQRRLVQAGRAGAGRTVKGLSPRLVHSVAGRAFAGTRVTEQAGEKTPGVEGARIGRWQGYRAAPLRRGHSPKQNGRPRPRPIPTLTGRARQAVSLQAWQPVAETPADPHSSGVRPERRCAGALDQGCKVLRRQSAAPGIGEGEIHGGFEHLRSSWIAAHMPVTK